MITYGNGEVLFEGSSQGFEMKYRGSIKIFGSPDNLFISASKNKIIGVMLDGTDMPNELFRYRGELKKLTCKTVKEGNMQLERISIQGVDYWQLDKEKWEDDDSLWGTRDGTFLVGGRVKFNKHRIVVNNNIRITSIGILKYADGSDVNSNELVHIHGDGVIMSGGVHTESSVRVYPIGTQKQSKAKLKQFKRASRGSGSSSGGGGY